MSHQTPLSVTHTNQFTASPTMCNPYGRPHNCDLSMAHPRAMTYDTRRPMAGSAITKGKTL
jgi:hypothetical protein